MSYLDLTKDRSTSTLKYHVKRIIYAFATVGAYLGLIIYICSALYYLIPDFVLLLDRF